MSAVGTLKSINGTAYNRRSKKLPGFVRVERLFFTNIVYLRQRELSSL